MAAVGHPIDAAKEAANEATSVTRGYQRSPTGGPVAHSFRFGQVTGIVATRQAPDKSFKPELFVLDLVHFHRRLLPLLAWGGQFHEGTRLRNSGCRRSAKPASLLDRIIDLRFGASRCNLGCFKDHYTLLSCGCSRFRGVTFPLLDTWRRDSRVVVCDRALVCLGPTRFFF